MSNLSKSCNNYPCTLHAPPTTYTVSYNANGGTGAPANQTKTHGVTLTLSSTKPTRTGYTFQGWATSQANANAGIVVNQPGGTYTGNAAITYWAIWKANPIPEPPTPQFTLGDIDSNGKIEIGDALEILKYLAGIKNVITVGGSDSNVWKAACITGNKPTINDGLEILKKLAGIKSLL